MNGLAARRSAGPRNAPGGDDTLRPYKDGDRLFLEHGIAGGREIAVSLDADNTAKTVSVAEPLFNLNTSSDDDLLSQLPLRVSQPKVLITDTHRVIYTLTLEALLSHRSNAIRTVPPAFNRPLSQEDGKQPNCFFVVRTAVHLRTSGIQHSYSLHF